MGEGKSVPAKGAWYALLVIALTNAMSLLDRNILAILAPRIKADLGVGDAEMGLLYGTVFALFYALFSLPLGRLADGWVRTRLLSLCIGFWSAATALAAFASSFGILALSRLGVGIGEGATQPAGTSLIYDYWPKERRGFVMAVLASSIAIGLGGSLVLGGVAANWWDMSYAGQAAPLGLSGWQFAFLAAATPGFLLALVLWRLKEPRRGAMDGIETPPDPAPFSASAAVLGSVTPGFNWFSLRRRGATGAQWTFNIVMLFAVIIGMVLLARLCASISPRPDLAIGSVSISPHVLQWSVIGFGIFVIVNLLQGLSLSDRPTFAVIAGSPTLIMVMAVGALQSVINYGIMGFTPSFLMKTYGLSMKDTALTFGLLSAALGIVGPMLSGPISDVLQRRFPGRGRSYVTLFALGLSPFVAMWVYTAPTSGDFYLRFSIYSIILTGWLPPLYAIMYDQVLPRMRGVTTSVYLLVMTILGLGTGPYVVGLISDATGGDLGTAILSINWVSPVIVVLLLIIATRAQRDEDGLLVRARAAGERV
ncbi:MFS transporter [Chakrabartia godavariana]|nr:MFS transporter [Chakrabartia godavariana]